VGINFSRNPDMPMPLGEERGDIGNMFLMFFNFYSFLIYIIFMCVYITDLSCIFYVQMWD
jgi:hypothetical protein